MTDELERPGRDGARRALPRRPDDDPPRHVRLPCGRDPGDLVEQVGDRAVDDLDEHQRACPHCRAALGEYARLWRGVEAVAAHDPAAPEAAIEEVLRRLRGAVADRDFGRVDAPPARDDPGGRIRISSRAVAVTAQELAATVRGVRVVLGRVVDPDPDPDPLPPGPRVVVTVGLVGRSAAVELLLAADLGVDLPDLGRRVRERVVRGVRDVFALEPVAVHVVVDDVLP